MVDSRQKGARVETQVKKLLKDKTGLNWQRVPASGALSAEHQLKGDLYIPQCNNKYCVEVKGYKEDHVNSGLLHHKTPQFMVWWEQTVREAKQINKEPLLIFKFDRSKMFVAFKDEPVEEYRHLYYSEAAVYICLLEDWLTEENPEFIYG